MNRRSFMKSILAAGVAPYICTTAGVLMPVRRTLAEQHVIDMEKALLFGVDFGRGPDESALAWIREMNNIMYMEMMINPPLILHPDGRVEAFRPSRNMLKFNSKAFKA
jgi:hypothetical protein